MTMLCYATAKKDKHVFGICAYVKNLFNWLKE